MKFNSETKIINSSVILIPYQKCHVEKYHNWMKSQELQNLTASSALNLEEEYGMQQSWLNDEDKCTFIILDFELFESKKNEIDAMIGDTNLFISDSDTDDESYVAEIEIMIAEPSSRRQKRGWHSILSMLRYGIDNLKIKEFVSKIGILNHSSISLFKKLKFVEESTSDVFQEITFKLKVDDSWYQWLLSQTDNYKHTNYELKP